MEAIILAGGLGTRLRSVIKNTPKPMAIINGHPFLEILLRHLKVKGFKKVILCIGYLKEKIISHFENLDIGIEIVYVIEDKLLGTGGAIKNALEYTKNDHIYIFNGDTYQDFDLFKLKSLWEQYNLPIMLLRSADSKNRYGGVHIKGRKVVKFSTKSNIKAFYINAGIYVLPTNIFDSYNLPKKFSIEDFFEVNVSALNITHCIAKNNTFIDIGTPADYDNIKDIDLKNWRQTPM
ncbi:GCD1 Nucleoside-diphosphate-sugar pyrophosphorylase involved in lipopolysaccharide biosynthesis/translation initiation factor 2B, gamma/epsilon subunits (eIF-2Bgamma/eIF-2Bepsilon) [Candidatus Methylopumilus universalis]|uniref:sugar phosphate nucleotidyltransferase n=1 Tax=Candidatus Methylopumilus universalis TaxID=2588536 RepID=UPI003BEEF8A5